MKPENKETTKASKDFLRALSYAKTRIPINFNSVEMHNKDGKSIRLFIWRQPGKKTICISEEELEQAQEFLFRCMLETDIDSKFYNYYSVFKMAMDYLYNEAFGGKTDTKESNDETRNHDDR